MLARSSQSFTQVREHRSVFSLTIIAAIGATLKIQVVAEGIETVMQRDFLSALGCSIGQGYLFGSRLAGGPNIGTA